MPPKRTKPVLGALKPVVPAELEGTQCHTCLKKEKVLGRYRCGVMKDFYFRWNPPANTCFAFEDNPRALARRLKELLQHNERLDRPERLPAVKLATKQVVAIERGAISGFEAQAMFHEESRKKIHGSGGESQDRTHKLFPESRMKDNRYMPKWGEES